MENLKFSVQSARQCWQLGMPIAADTYMRHALGYANALKNPRLRAGVMRILNKMRPTVNRAYADLGNEISK